MAGLTDQPTPASGEPVETREKREGEDKPLSAKFWHSEINAAGNRDKNWHQRAKKVVERYRDERDAEDSRRIEKKANVLWSNTEILRAALFQRVGPPDVRKRFPRKGKDERTVRQAALILERSIVYVNDAYRCDEQIEAAVEDVLLPGRGVCWVVYDCDFDGDGNISKQSVRDEHVYWEDYRESAGRSEKDIWWKARGHYYSRDELKEYFADHADKIPLNASLLNTNSYDQTREDQDTFKRARVWEIWDKSKRQRVWIAEGYDTILKTDQDPYGLQDFYPCPPALYRVKTTGSRVPIPEYTLYQDQANELDVITTRLSKLTEALKRRGVYDAGADGGSNQLAGLAFADDNQFLPYNGFAGLMEKGGLKNVFQVEDLEPTIKVITGLYQRAENLINTIYQVTGISDVIRGSSNPNETLGAQQLKANFGSMRLQKSQTQVQNFIRDLMRIKSEIIAEHWTRENLAEMTGLEIPTNSERMQAQQQLQAIQAQMQASQQAQQQPLPQATQQPGEQPQQMGHNGGPPMQAQAPAALPPGMDPATIQELIDRVRAPTWEELSAILRSDKRRGYKVDIETDDTARVDEQAEKQSRIEFLTTMLQFFEKVLPAMKMEPALAPLTREMTKFTVGAFKAGRPLEEAFDDAFEALEKSAQEAAKNGPPQDPVQVAKAQEIQAKVKAAAETHQADMAMKQQTMKANLAATQMDLQGKQMKLQTDIASTQAEHVMNQEKFALQREQMAQDAIHRQEQAHIDRTIQVQDAAARQKRDEARFAASRINMRPGIA